MKQIVNPVDQSIFTNILMQINTTNIFLVRNATVLEYMSVYDMEITLRNEVLDENV